MSKLNLTEYHKRLKQNKIVDSLKTLKTLYEMADNSLSIIASCVELSDEEAKTEGQLLQDQEMLITLAVKTKCNDMQMISQKVDFLNTTLLKEKAANDFSPTDVLTQSIWEDCQIYL